MLDLMQNTLILGKGISGYAAKNLLEIRNKKYIIVDENDHTLESFRDLCKNEDFSHCVISPGFSNNHPWLKFVKSINLNVLTEFELGWSELKGKTIAITGSNGKSTALKILYETFILAGLKVSIGGNYGIPTSQLAVEKNDIDWYLLEISSFQLENITNFKPHISILLNVYPNHLDRHNSFDEYMKIKFKILTQNSCDNSLNIFPYRLTNEILVHTSDLNNCLTFGIEEKADYKFKNGFIFAKDYSPFCIQDTFLDKINLCETTAPALLAVINHCDIDPNIFLACIKTFKGLKHRISSLGFTNNIEFVNDSKSTNMTAMINAVRNFKSKNSIKLIAGGVLKEKNITFVKEILAECNVTLYAYGKSASCLCDSWGDRIPFIKCSCLRSALFKAYDDATIGDIVLLSPGCSSYDQFTSYIERGNYFEELVDEIRLVNEGEKNEE